MNNYSFYKDAGNNFVTGNEALIRYGFINADQLSSLEPHSTLINSIDIDVSGERRSGSNPPYILFAGTKRFLNEPEYESKYNLIMIDEPQLAMSDVMAIRNQNPNAVRIYFTAFPPSSLLTVCDSVLEERHLAIVQQRYLKEPRFVTIYTNDHTEGFTHADAMLESNLTTEYQNSTVFNNEVVWGKMVNCCQDLKRFVPDNAGIIFKCASIANCVKLSSFIVRNYTGIRVRCISSDNSRQEIAQIKCDYEEGRIDVLVVCKMLAVGFHNARTSIVCACYSTTNFQELLQFFGRSSSVRDRRSSVAYFVSLDLFYNFNHFDELYSRYSTGGFRAVHDEDHMIVEPDRLEGYQFTEGETREGSSRVEPFALVGQVADIQPQYTIRDIFNVPQSQPSLPLPLIEPHIAMSTSEPTPEPIPPTPTAPTLRHMIPILKPHTQAYLLSWLLNEIRQPLETTEVAKITQERNLYYVGNMRDEAVNNLEDHILVFDGNFGKMATRLNSVVRAERWRPYFKRHEKTRTRNVSYELRPNFYV